MSYKREMIQVGVSRRILWIGAEAYPLHNIARAQTIKLLPKHGAAWVRYVRAVVLSVLLGVVAAVAINNAESLQADSEARSGLLQLALAVVSVLIVVSTIRLIRALMARTLYALVIETAGTPRTALVTFDESMVTNLVHRIMDAINNPQAEFQTQVNNLHLGDKIQQVGSQSVGKVATR